jgi:DNA-binding response OmpR family regulator
MANTDIAFRNFLSFLSPDARGVLLATAERVAAVLRQGGPRAQTSNALAAAMPGLAIDDQQAMLWYASKHMEVAPKRFDLLYVQEDSQIGNESRSYAVVSNIMKIKHTTLRRWILRTR